MNMDIGVFSEKKTVNLEEEIKKKQSRVYYIWLQDREKLNIILDEIRKKDLFNKYCMSYAYTVHEDHIALLFHKEFEFI